MTGTEADEEADDAEEADIEEAAADEDMGTLTLPMPMPSVVATGVPLRAAFWYHGKPKRSGTQLKGLRVSLERRERGGSEQSHRASQPCCFRPG